MNENAERWFSFAREDLQVADCGMICVDWTTTISPLATLTLFPEHCQKVCPGWPRPERQFPWRKSRWKNWRPPVSHSMH